MDEDKPKSKVDILIETVDKILEENGYPKSETMNKQGSFVIVSPRLVRRYKEAKGIKDKK